MLLLLAVRFNTERFNYAYPTYLGRFGKTIGESPQLTVICMIRLLCRMGCILCFACTFRVINTTDGILT